MFEKKIILSLLFLVVIISPCYICLSLINPIESGDDDKIDTNNINITTPKSSGYDVSEKWNYTTENDVYAVAVSADGKYMAIGTDYSVGSGEKYNTLFLKKISTNETIWVYNTTMDVWEIALSYDGEFIAVAAGNYSFLFNNTPSADKKPIWTAINGNAIQRYRTVDISKTGDKIVVGDYDPGMNGGVNGHVYMFDNKFYSGDKNDEVLWYNKTEAGDVYDVAISGDGNYVVAGIGSSMGCDSVFFWNTTGYTLGAQHSPMWSYDANIGISSVAITYNGYYIVAAGHYSDPYDEILVFNKSDEGVKVPEWSIDWGDTLGDYMNSVAISQDCEYIAIGAGTANNDGDVCLYSRSQSQKLWNYTTNGQVRSVDISADGAYIVAGTQSQQEGKGTIDNTIFLFNKSADATKTPEWVFNTLDHVYSVSMAALGNYIGAGGDSTSGEAYMFYHARPVPPALLPYIADDDDDDDDEPAIPLGNYYLLFAGLAIVALIVIIKRKALLKRKM